ncbi:MAG: BLUF domain-containing protein [Geodermatophilaceae bacterium]|nr:BLUF domain-containing protein [Geodermatophilaceae bacterium]
MDRSESTFRLIYVSRNRIPAAQRAAELDAILATARENNPRYGVTGALLASDDWFTQTLEGEEATVRALLAVIEADPRQEGLVVLQAGVVEGRVFGRWSMARVDEDGGPEVALIVRGEDATQTVERGTPDPMTEVLLYMSDVLQVADPPD